jgi:hypothetical protein
VDCALYDWETARETPPGIVKMSAAEARAHLRRTLRIVYPVARDSQFDDLLRALSEPAND